MESNPFRIWRIFARGGERTVGLIVEIGVESVGAAKLGASFFVAKKFISFFATDPNASDVARQGMRLFVVLIEILCERSTVTRDPDPELFEHGEVFDDGIDLSWGE